MSKEVIEFINANKVIAICRRLYGTELYNFAQALQDGGLKLIEVTFDQSDADNLERTGSAISQLKQKFGDNMRVGAGTVLTAEQVACAKEAGAEFIISPNTDADVIRATLDAGMVSIPGAMTPSEILAAHKLGAHFIKLFPTGYLGVKYIKDIMAPINHVKLVATGGVNEESLPEYLKLGFAGAGVSGRLLDRKLIQENDFAEITARAKRFAEIVKSCQL